MNNGTIERALPHDVIKWTFNPPTASERLVRTVLVSVWHRQAPTDEALITVLCEAEEMLNDRQITKVSEDLNDMEPLTPNRCSFWAVFLKGVSV